MMQKEWEKVTESRNLH